MGPYGAIYGKVHPWGGHVGFSSSFDIGGGGADFLIVLNDDRPGMGDPDNGGRIPTARLVDIDKLLDDGDLPTGKMRGDGSWPAAPEEGMTKNRDIRVVGFFEKIVFVL